MKVATAGIMRKLDQKAIAEFGIPGMVLMENAARGTVNALFRHFPDLLNSRVGILVGRGNNGGDGLAVARYLANRGISFQVFLFAGKESIQGDAAINLQILNRMGVPVQEILNLGDWDSVKPLLASQDLLIDGIFGTGLKGPVEGFFREIIEFVNSLKRPVVSIDTPSGLDVDSGQILGVCIQARLTVTYGLAKRGLLVHPGAQAAGDLAIIDISLPGAAVQAEKIQDHLIEGADFLSFLAPRNPDAHKGNFGHLFVLAGSPGKTGAAALVSQAALQIGTGLVTLGIPESLNPILEEKLTEVMTEPLAETKAKTLSASSQQRIFELLSRKTALTMGPGLSLNAETARLIQQIIRKSALPEVIDADALSALGGRTDILGRNHPPRILTPHPGEMARLLGISVDEVQKDRIEIARKFATEHGVILVLKGSRSLVADSEGEVFINPTGNPGMASGGTGDVLTGMIGGFLAQGLPPLEAAKLGVYLHGLTGDYLASLLGERGVTASGIIAESPKLLRALAEGTGRVGNFSFPLQNKIWY
jgi:ADP-dependent NAD(P)H-hydrate dehydratase / NAD(P)H-hydrate epimerase